MTTYQLIDNLEEIISELANHKDTEMGDVKPLIVVYMPTYGENFKENFLNIIKNIGSFTKRYDDNYLHCEITRGKTELDIYIDRSAVCKKQKVMKEVEDWVCEPLFQDGELNAE